MVKRHARRRKKAAMQTSQTDAERIALIPGGPVNPHRAARDQFDLEDRAVTDRGTALIVGQIVSTPVRKLLMQGHVSLEEAAAAHLYARDHDAAYASSSNPLGSLSAACTRVDGGVADPSARIERKAHHGPLFRRASQHLRSEMASIAAAAILRHAGVGNDAGYAAIGSDLLPGASQQEQRAAGKGAVVLMLRELAVFYGAAAHARREFCSRTIWRPRRSAARDSEIGKNHEAAAQGRSTFINRAQRRRARPFQGRGSRRSFFVSCRAWQERNRERRRGEHRRRRHKLAAQPSEIPRR